MNVSAFVNILNQFDEKIFSAVQKLFSYAPIFKQFFLFFTFIGEKGWLFFLVAAIFFSTKKYRQEGRQIFLSLVLAGILSNLILKVLIARERPFNNLSSQYYSVWRCGGFPFEDGFSCPSGHTTAATAFFVSLLLSFKKPSYIALAVIPVFMGISRIYLVAHYPSDVVLSFFVGTASALSIHVYMPISARKKAQKMGL